MKLFRSFSIYALATFVNTGISFLLIPFFTRYLTKADYGILGLFNIVYTLLLGIISLSTNGIILAEYYRKERKENGILIFNALLVNAVLCAVTGVIFFIFRKFISDQLDMPPRIVPLLPLVAFIAIPIQFFTLILQLCKREFFFAIITVGQALSITFLNLYLVKDVNMGWEGKLYAMLAINSLFLIISIVFLWKSRLIVFSIDRKIIKSIFKFGLPLIPHLIGYLIIESSDRFFIKSYVGIEELGIYNSAYQIAMIINVLDNTFTQAYSPFLSENLTIDTDESKIRISKVGFLYIVLLLTATIGVSLLASFVFHVFIDHKFYDAHSLVPWIAFSYFFLGVYKVFAGVIYFCKKTYYFTYLSIANLVCNLGLNFLLIPVYGVLGAAIATFISYFLLCIATLVMSQKLKKIPWLYLLNKREKYVL